VLIWIVLAGLTAIVLFVLLRPLTVTGTTPLASESFDAAVYRDQINEIESDRARGLINDNEAEAARVEIARRLLAADNKAQGRDGSERSGASAKAAIAIISVILPLLALGLYFAFGSPRLPDQPLAARLEAPANDRDFEALVARVEARLRERPEDGEGWDVVAPVYLSSGRYAQAAEAYSHALRLLGPSAKRLSGQGQALVLANNGLVTEEARLALTRARELDGTLIEPRILLAIAKEQDGQFAAAVADWRALLGDAEEDAPWRAMVQKRIETAEAQLARKPMTADTPAQTTPQGEKGPGAAEIAAAQDVDPAARQAMIEGMVQRLAARLDQGGGSVADWLRLVRAYSVLDRKDEALKALARARSQFSGDTKALEELDQLAEELGLKS
jgi:cytochrome c-type biogenesis protein CcmH